MHVLSILGVAREMTNILFYLKKRPFVRPLIISIRSNRWKRSYLVYVCEMALKGTSICDSPVQPSGKCRVPKMRQTHLKYALNKRGH